MRFPTQEDIVKLNRRLIEQAGGEYLGKDNLQNEGSLKWVLEAIRYPLFGIDRYPTLVEKAAILAWTIIDGHVFYDGCKRTGMAGMIIFLRMNDSELNATKDEIIETAVNVADHSAQDYQLEDFTDWISSKLATD